MKTYSELTRGSSQAEALLRASLNDLVEHQGDAYADAIRAAYPHVRIFSYSIYRTISPGTAAEWIAFAGINAEAGFLHQGGNDAAHRRRNPTSGTPGQPSTYWYPMNMGNQNYVNWQNSNVLKILLGIRYGSPQFSFPPPLDAVLVDNTLWYSNYDDVNHDGILNTDEYAGTGELFRTKCLNAFVSLKNYIIAAAALVPNAIVYPNTGNLLEYERADADTAALIAACPKLLLGEQVIKWTVGEPNLTAENCELRFATMNTLLNGTRELMIDSWVNEGESQPNRDKAKIGCASFMLLGYKAGLIARYYQGPDDQADPIETWEDSSLLKMAHAALGDPISAYAVLSGVWTKGKVFTRDFQFGRVYLYVRKAGQTGANDAVITIPAQSFILGPDGTGGSLTSTVTLALGEGAIAITNNITDVLDVVAPIPGPLAIETRIEPAAVVIHAPIIGSTDPNTGFPRPPIFPPFTEE